MTFPFKAVAASALFALGAAAPALADPFTLNPHAAKLNGSKFTADTFVLSDYAQIKFAPTSATTSTFVDTGYLPVIGFRLNGQPIQPTGYGAPDGGGWGAYIQYIGTGTQVVSPQGIPVSASYQTLSYNIVGYDGLATFGLAADGSATVGGAISDVATLDSGSLISGSLAFTFPPGQPAPTIVGQVQATLNEDKPQFIQANPGGLDVTFIHPPGEYFFTSATTLEIAGGTSSSATIVSSKGGSSDATVGLPEPASAGLLGLGLASLGWLRTRRRAAG